CAWCTRPTPRRRRWWRSPSSRSDGSSATRWWPRPGTRTGSACITALNVPDDPLCPEIELPPEAQDPLHQVLGELARHPVSGPRFRGTNATRSISLAPLVERVSRDCIEAAELRDIACGMILGEDSKRRRTPF